MGIVGRQSFWNLLITYSGVVLGALNFIVLFPLFFSAEQLGLIRLLQSLGLVSAQLAQLGTPMGALRFYDLYKADPGRLLRVIYGLCLTGTALFLAVYILARPLIIETYQSRSPLFLSYYYYVVPITISMLLLTVWESIAMARLQTTPPAFLREVASRFLLLGLVAIFAFQLVDFQRFIWGWTVLQVALVFVLPLWLGGAPFFRLQTAEPLAPQERNKFIRYSLYAAFSGGSTLLVFNIDSIMLGAMVGLSSVGVYGIYLNIATLISIPNRALARIMHPLMVQAWNEDRKDEVHKLYRQSALLPLIVGGWIFGGVHLNRETLFYFLRRPEYAENYEMFLYLSAAFILNSGFGLNNNVLVSSALYRFDAYFNVLMVVLTAASNYFLIKLFGGVGSAIATALTLLVMNAMKWGFIRNRFGMNPFSRKYFIALGVALPALALTQYLPPLHRLFWLDVPLRSLIFTALYFTPVYFLRLVPELNNTLASGLQKLKRFMP